MTNSDIPGTFRKMSARKLLLGGGGLIIGIAALIIILHYITASASSSSSQAPLCTFGEGAAVRCHTANPQVEVDLVNEKSNPDCTFHMKLRWNDGSAQQNITIHGGPSGPEFLARHTYASPGTYQIHLTGTASPGCTVSPTIFGYTLLKALLLVVSP